MKKKINIGIIGYGKWGKIIYSNLVKSSLLNIVFIDNSKCSNAHLYHLVDWVIVVTKSVNHLSLCKKFIRLKKNIICEKPFTNSYRQARYLYNFSKKNNVKIFINNIEAYKFNVLKKFDLKEKNEMKIINYRNKNYNTKDFIQNILYHDFTIISKFFEFKIPRIEIILKKKLKKQEIIFEKQNKRILLSFKPSKKNVHKICNLNLLRKKDFIKKFFSNIIFSRENYENNMKQTLFAMKLLDILRLNTKKIV